ncbi:Prefoldin subunit 5, partial [Mortierella sp. GBA43]
MTTAESRRGLEAAGRTNSKLILGLYRQLKAINTTNDNKTILVPLTSSLYVPGKLANVEKVVVDIGTGYYVEKTVEDAIKFYNAK